MSKESAGLHFSDYTLLRRIKEYVKEAGDPEKINKDSMVEDLRIKYKEYGRRQKCAFRALSIRALKMIIENLKNGNENEEEDGDDAKDQTEEDTEENNVSTDVDKEGVDKPNEDGSEEKEKLVSPKAKAGSNASTNDSPAKASEGSDIELSLQVDEFDNNQYDEDVDAPLEIDEDPVVSNTSRPYMESIQRMANQARMMSSAVKAEPIDISSEEEQSPSKLYPHIFNSNAVHIQRVDPKSKKSRPGDSRPGPKCSKKKQKRAPEHHLDDRIRRHIHKKIKLTYDCIIPPETFALFGGFTNVLQSVSELVIHVKQTSIYQILGATPPRGFLLHGPPGCGKTLLAKAIAGELCVPLVRLNGPELVAGVSGESESRIRDLFDFATQFAPCILFIDEIDALCPSRDLAKREMERRIVAQLLTSMDGLGESPRGSRVVVIGATNRPDALDPALRRAGRFDREVCLGIPDRSARLQILQVLTASMKIKDDLQLEEIAAATPGFVGADLKALTSEAAIAAVNRGLQEEGRKTVQLKDKPSGTVSEEADKVDEMPINNDESQLVSSEVAQSWIPLLNLRGPLISNENLAKLYIEMEDFKEALKKVQPSAKREGFATVPDVTWDDIGSLKDIRAELERSIMLPVKHPKEFAMFGITAPAGILLCGPPGCGKTLLAKAVANEANINFISVKGPELLNMYVGESERAVRQCFQRARNSQPCVIFFDEIDALCPKRTASVEGHNSTSRVVNQVLTEMDGVEGREGVFLMAATNRPDMVDPAVLRPGRLDKVFYVGLPTGPDRVDIIRALTKNGTRPILKDVDLDKIGNDERLEGFTGADLAALVKEASLIGLTEYLKSDCEESKKCVTEEYFYQAMSKINPSVTPMQREHYEKLQAYYSTPGLRALRQ